MRVGVKISTEVNIARYIGGASIYSTGPDRESDPASPRLSMLEEEREVCRKHAADDGNADHPGKYLIYPIAVFAK